MNKHTNSLNMATATIIALIVFTAITLSNIPSIEAYTDNRNNYEYQRIREQDVQVLTLKPNTLTTGRRNNPIQQLTCVGGDACSHANKITSMQCENKGWDGTTINWRCEAIMDDYYRLGKTEISCEGYDYAGDPYILAGSCAAEYELWFTQKYRDSLRPQNNNQQTTKTTTTTTLSQNVPLYTHNTIHNHHVHSTNLSSDDSFIGLFGLFLLICLIGLLICALCGECCKSEEPKKSKPLPPSNPLPSASSHPIKSSDLKCSNPEDEEQDTSTASTTVHTIPQAPPVPPPVIPVQQTTHIHHHNCGPTSGTGYADGYVAGSWNSRLNQPYYTPVVPVYPARSYTSTTTTTNVSSPTSNGASVTSNSEPPKQTTSVSHATSKKSR